MRKVRFVPFIPTRLGNRVIGFTIYLIWIVNFPSFCWLAHDVKSERHDNFTLNLAFTIIGESRQSQWFVADRFEITMKAICCCRFLDIGFAVHLTLSKQIANFNINYLFSVATLARGKFSETKVDSITFRHLRHRLLPSQLLERRVEYKAKLEWTERR